MELRWLKGNWKFGKYKLQYRWYPGEPGKPGSSTPWIDVPTVEDKTKEKSLAEKFTNRLVEWKNTSVPWTGILGDIPEALAKIAEDHFNPKP